MVILLRISALFLLMLAGAFPLWSQNEGNDPSTWPPHFVSLTPDLLYEVEPSDYVANPASLDGAQLFYAPVQDGETVASLQGAAVILVRPYNTVDRQEAALREWECVWGTLDHLYREEVPLFWRRPSTAFYSCTHPTLPPQKAGDRPKVQVDFTQWWSGMPAWAHSMYGVVMNNTITADKNDQWIYLHLKDFYDGCKRLQNNPADKTIPPLLAKSASSILSTVYIRGQLGEDWVDSKKLLLGCMKDNSIADFRSLNPTLWQTMLNRHLSDSTVRDAWVTGRWCAAANADRPPPYLHWWLRDWQSFHALGTPGNPGNPVWDQEFTKTLNETAGLYDGFLCLKDAERLERDYPKTDLMPLEIDNFEVDTSRINSQSSKKAKLSDMATFYQAIQKYAGVPSPKKAPSPPEVHLVPFAAKVHQKGTAETDDTTALAKAVVLSDGLAITCDWKDRSSMDDGITVTKTYQSNATLELDLKHRVERAEYSRIERGLYAIETNPATQEASYRWKGPDSGVLLREPGQALQSPAAFKAGISGLKYRLLIAVRQDIGDKWTLMAEPEPMKPETLAHDTYYAYTKENLAQTVRQTGCRSLAKSITFSNPEKPGSYRLYEVDVVQDYALTPCIRYGNMKHVWVLRKGKHYKYTDRTEMTEVYAILGDSTWPKSGTIAERPAPYNHTVLVWVDALKAMTSAYMADRNTYRNEATLKPPANAFFHLTTYPVGPGYPSQADTYNGRAVFRSGYSKQVVPYIQVGTQWQPSTEDVLIVFDVVRLVGDVLSGHGASDPKAMCLEAACMTAVLPRICGFREHIEVHWAAERIDNVNGSPYTVNGHYFNVINNMVYDATPYYADPLFPDQNVKQDQMRFNNQYQAPYLNEDIMVYMQRKGFNNNLLRKVCTKIKLEAITALNP